jgi:hypothetical protein
MEKKNRDRKNFVLLFLLLKATQKNLPAAPCTVQHIFIGIIMHVSFLLVALNTVEDKVKTMSNCWGGEGVEVEWGRGRGGM